jgi:hypothetical protein
MAFCLLNTNARFSINSHIILVSNIPCLHSVFSVLSHWAAQQKIESESQAAFFSNQQPLSH